MDYMELTHKPSINNVELVPGMELADIGIVEMTSDMISEIILEIFGILL